jgi:predicted HicB family RNase H-like nuclease
VVRVPKKLRKQARELARQSDTNLDEIVATALAAEVRRRSG